jgi:hypothetical protein
MESIPGPHKCLQIRVLDSGESKLELEHRSWGLMETLLYKLGVQKLEMKTEKSTIKENGTEE